MKKQLIIVTAPHDVEPAAGQVTCSQGSGHCAGTGCVMQGLQFYKSMKILIFFDREIFTYFPQLMVTETLMRKMT